MRAYSVYDSKAGCYSHPFYTQNNATAIRNFTKAATQQGHDFNIFPGDYTLFCLGDWDDRTGMHTPLEAFENLGLAINYITQ